MKSALFGFLLVVLPLLMISDTSGSAAARGAEPAGCSSETTLCLGDGRFLVDATWTKPDGESGIAHAVALTSDSGYFWFLEPGNVEVAAKVLDGCATNRRYWFFGAGLTNLQAEIHVTDTVTNEVRTYTNAQGHVFKPVTDTSAFGGCPAIPASAADPEELSPSQSVAAASPSSAPDIGCDSSDTLLCIDGRFAVAATWETASGRSGPAHAVSLGSEAGYFWFFEPTNVEMIVKTLDACGLGRGNWFFAAGLTTVGVHVSATDTFTGEIRAYDNPVGTPFVPIQDTGHFAFCPTATPTPSPTLTVTPTSTMTITPTPTRTPRAPSTPGPTQNVYMHISCGFGICYEWGWAPNDLHIRVGDVVFWSWSGSHGPHSTTSGTCSGDACSPSGIWDSGSTNGPGFVRRFDHPGTYPYYCVVGHVIYGQHVHESGTITVDP